VNEKLSIGSGNVARVSRQAAAVALLIALNFFALVNFAQSAPATSNEGAIVIVVKATNECFTALVRASGFLVSRVEAAVGIEADGSRLTEVLVDEGDVVTAGQIMARFARPTYDAPNVPGGAGAPTSGNPRPSIGVLRAPSAGRVTQSTANVGGTASIMGEPLFRVAVEDEIELEVDVPSIHVPLLAPGQRVRVALEEGRDVGGSVRLVRVEINPMTQMGRARISVAGDPSLHVGKFVRATIDVGRSCGVAVPRSAISYRTEGTTVQIVRNGVVLTRNIRIGLRSDLTAEIQEGLAEGDVVVANAGTSLRDGDKVRPVLRVNPD
jgi:HlyD family secretion protein